MPRRWERKRLLMEDIRLKARPKGKETKNDKKGQGNTYFYIFHLGLD